jgi:hypothetical protein
MEWLYPFENPKLKKITSIYLVSDFNTVTHQMAAILLKTIRKPDKKGTKPDKKSGFQIVGPFEIRIKVFLTSSLDRFVMIKYFYDPFLYKTV